MTTTKNKTEDIKKKTLVMLRNAPAIFALLSNCTNMPFVECDGETFDDEIFLFFKEEDAKKEAERRMAAKEPVHITKVVNRFLLQFYTSLFPLGINCMVVGKGTKDEVSLQLTDLVQRPEEDTDQEGKIRIENKEFQLTAMYLMQELRSGKNDGVTEEMKELQEEMMAHYQEGRYIVAIKEGQKIPLLKQPNGEAFQPLFTDFHEFMKFQNGNKDGKFQTAVVEAEKIPEILSSEAVGVTVNPFGVNIVLKVNKPAAKPQQPQA